MRFRSQLININTFAKFTASLSSLGKICWVRLEDEVVRFTIIPDQGTQVWAQLPIDTVFESYSVSAASGVINLEVPIGALHRALRSASSATSAQLRLTKKGSLPLLALTIVASSWTSGKNALGVGDSNSTHDTANPNHTDGPRERETVITQEIPVRVLPPSIVEGLHEPRCRSPDVHIVLPSLIQLKSISERFTKLAMDSAAKSIISTTTFTSTQGAGAGSTASNSSPKLELSANMHGSLKLSIATDTLRISSVWTGLLNPPLDLAQLSQNELEQLPSERMRELGGENGEGEEGWAKVRIDGKDWGRVLSVGRLSPRVVACFIHETALILYVYLPDCGSGEDSCLTYYINSYAV
ncbi:cell cycle checkpoint protein (Hus1) [Paracoccidioides lutzii Pb01]|uniref:Checkpoint protein n=1 Tax=Paracoccidioides lutzii (strain ATCC MYA-826 / Pb01) TaxID=502779 RepID=C1H1E5_PARBA|nr:cell cycle checkpoint protein (Hus1) [Paracoccidioides lutzii Pb01]EEH33539.2 cell cycle checkpoint protein (Hus1) [Paracoccidioides lutzii Pb01]